jgi:hypothetical protein
MNKKEGRFYMDRLYALDNFSAFRVLVGLFEGKTFLGRAFTP